MKDDPVIDRIRNIRHEISEKCGHKPEKLIDYYMELQKRHKNNLIHLNEKKQTSDT